MSCWLAGQGWQLGPLCPVARGGDSPQTSPWLSALALVLRPDRLVLAAPRSLRLLWGSWVPVRTFGLSAVCCLQALNEEKVAYDRSPSKNIYLNVAVNTLKKLRGLVPSTVPGLSSKFWRFRPVATIRGTGSRAWAGQAALSPPRSQTKALTEA